MRVSQKQKPMPKRIEGRTLKKDQGIPPEESTLSYSLKAVQQVVISESLDTRLRFNR